MHAASRSLEWRAGEVRIQGQNERVIHDTRRAQKIAGRQRRQRGRAVPHRRSLKVVYHGLVVTSDVFLGRLPARLDRRQWLSA